MAITRNNVFSGPEAVKRFLNPDYNPPLPLVEIPGYLNPFQKDGVRIFAKLMNFLPLANVKSLPAYNMLFEQERAGQLRGVKNLIENSSGNTVFSLAVIGKIFGIPKTKAIVSHEVGQGKLQLLRFLGTEITINEEPICPDPADKESGIYKAKEIGKKKGWLNPGQYDNKDNPAAHEKWTGPQIWEQIKGKINVFCTGLGTTGTMVGAGGYLKKKNPKIINVGVVRFPNNPVPGVRTSNLLRQISFDWQGVTDHIERVGTKESFEKSLEFCRAGLMVGPGSGFAFQGLLQFIARQKKKKGMAAVFICPDSPLPYLNEYFEYLDDSHFPKVENEELLGSKPGYSSSVSEFEIEPDMAHQMIYEDEERIRPRVTVIDIRSRGEFLHFHLPGAKQMGAYKIADNASKLAKDWEKQKVVLICQMGIRTRVLAEALRQKGVEAYSIKGGTTEWSARNLPRWRSEICLQRH